MTGTAWRAARRQEAATDRHTSGPEGGWPWRGRFPSRAKPRLIFCACPILLGVIGLAGWVLDMPLLKSLAPGMTTMKANTAIGLLAAGLGTLLLPALDHPRAKGDLRPLLCGLAASLALALGLLTLAEYVFGLRLGLDELLFADPHTTSPPYPGRMSPATSVGLSCAGAAILLLRAATTMAARETSTRCRLAQGAHLLAAAPAAIGYLNVTGYAYHVDKLYNFGAFVAVAFHTALAFATLGPALLLTQPRLGWGRALIAHPAASDAFRRLLPVSLAFPFLAGLLVVWGARARIYDPLYGPALFALATAGASIGLAWIGAMVVRGAEDRLREANGRLAASELALRQANEGLEARVREEVAAREAAQALLAHGQRMEALGQLAGGIAHDFNNVMQAIQGGAGLIRRRTTDPRAVDDIARMVEVSVQRGISVTRRLLAFARRDELRAQRVDPVALLTELREVLAHGFGSLIDIRLDMPGPGTSLSLVADKGQLETVMINLAANGRDAMPAGGTLTLTAAEDMGAGGMPTGRSIRLAVADTGEGMSEAVLARAAEPFFTTKAPGQGTGLGLAMARSFAEQSGGRLSITTAPGQGTVVTLWLPAASPLALPSAPEGAAPCAPRLGATVLVVDDEDLVREVLAAGLTDLGHIVLQASDGAAALAMLRAGAAVDVLLTDYAMPGMNGLALIGEARALRPGLPAVLLTGNAALTALGEAEGIRRLRKPVRAAELAVCIAEIVEPTGQTQARRLAQVPLIALSGRDC